MGIVNFGVPLENVEFIKSNMDLSVFVEGGTYLGGTAREMSKMFRSVITIENSEKMYEQARKNLMSFANIRPLYGDTREHINNLLKDNNNILFWLDAHWSGGNTYGEHDECPLLRELEIIFEIEKHKNIAILIDDARLFLAPPPLPHNLSQWPSISDLSRILPNNWGMICYNDVIYMLPDKNLLSLREFLQPKITKNTKANVKLIARVKNILNKLFRKSK